MFKRISTLLIKIATGFIVLSLSWVLLYKFAPVKWTSLMFKRSIQNIEHETKGKKIRGCSTISQQVAKNCFSFCGHSWWRKGFETYYTLLIELFWSKERIMEVYLNIAEMGKGVFGVEAAAQNFFDRSAAKLNTHQAVCIACVLQNPPEELYA